jgi:hypothetical protein
MESKNIDDILRMAKEREEATSKERTEAVVSEIEQGTLIYQEAAGEDAAWTERLREIDGEIGEIRVRMQAVALGRIEVEASEDLKKQPDLRAEALENLRKEEDELKAALEHKEQERLEAENLQKAARANKSEIAGKVRPYLTEREIPPKKLDEIWKYIEEERKFEEKKREYEQHALREAEEYAFSIARAPRQNIREFTWKEGVTYLWGLPRDIFFDPRIHNAYVDKFDEVFNRIIIEKQIRSEWREGPKDKKGEPLNEQQLQAIQQAKTTFVYKDKAVVLWDSGKPQAHEEEPPPPEFFSRLTPNEQNIVRDAIKTRKNKEDLLAKLKLSEYQPEIHQQILDAAAAEDAEYVAAKLKEKEPALQAATGSAREQLENKEQERKDLETAQRDIKRFNEKKQEHASSEGGLNNYRQYKQEQEVKREAFQKNRDELKRWPKFFGVGGGVRGIKEKKRDYELEEKIKELNTEIAGWDARMKETKERLLAVKQEMDAYLENIRRLAPQAIGENGEPVWSVFEAANRAWIAEKEQRELQRRLEAMRKTGDEWRQGRFLNFSLEEMRFLVPEYGKLSRIDMLAGVFCKEMERFFDNFSLWSRMPETTWTVKSGTLSLVDVKPKVDARFYGDKVSDDWENLESLHSKSLMTVLEEKVRKRLADKFGSSKIGELHFAFSE